MKLFTRIAALYLLGTYAIMFPLRLAFAKEIADELNVWVMATTEQQQQDMKELLRPYLLKNSKLRVNITVLPWETAWTKINAAAASGQGPDIVELGTTWVAAISATGALEQINQTMQQEVGGAQAFFPAMWSSTHRYNDPRVYAIPWYADARAAFYRTDVFKAANVNPKDAFANWGSFKQAMQKINGQVIQGKKIAALAYPGRNDLNIVHNLAPWIWNAGGDFVSADKKRSTINSPEAAQAIHYYTSFAVEGLVPKTALEKDSIQIENGFFNGQYAVIFSGPWALKQLNTPKSRGGHLESITAKNFAIAPYPAGIKGQQTFFSGSDLVIMKSSKNKPGAWKLLCYLVSKEAQIEFAKASGMLPTRLDAAHDVSLMNDPHYAEFLNQIKNGRHYPTIPSWGPIEAIYLKNISKILDIVLQLDSKNATLAIKKTLDTSAQEADQALAIY